MEDKIEVGEYVRTDKGYIVKIDKKKKNLQMLKFLDVEYGNILKHSKNIIDLIEDEDIVILEYKTPKYRERIERKFIVCKIDDFINFENRNCNFTYKVGDKKIVDKICKNIKVKGILTTEQFNNEYYRLEE